MISIQDSESCDPSSNLGRTFSIFLSVEHKFLWNQQFCFGVEGRGRDSSVGRALDWRSKGPRFDPGSRHFALGSLVFLLLTQLLQLCSVKKKNVRPTWGSNPRPWDFFFVFYIYFREAIGVCQGICTGWSCCVHEVEVSSSILATEPANLSPPISPPLVSNLAMIKQY